MNDAGNGSRWSTLAGGVILILGGALFLAQTLDLVHYGGLVGLVRDYWPMLFVAFGITKLFDRESRGGGLTMIAIGIWLQISNLGLFGLDWSDSWPVLLVLLGAGMILHAIIDAVSPRNEPGEGGGPHAPQP